MAEECIRIADDSSQDFFVEDRNGKSVVVPDHARVHRDRLRVDARKWFLAKRDAKKYGDRLELEASGEPIKISWLQTDQAPPVAPEPQRLIEYRKPELPADLSERDWSVLVSLLETVKRTIPSNSDEPARARLRHHARRVAGALRRGEAS
jgi:hypothetical protein